MAWNSWLLNLDKPLSHTPTRQWLIWGFHSLETLKRFYRNSNHSTLNVQCRRTQALKTVKFNSGLHALFNIFEMQNFSLRIKLILNEHFVNNRAFILHFLSKSFHLVLALWENFEVSSWSWWIWVCWNIDLLGVLKTNVSEKILGRFSFTCFNFCFMGNLCRSG